MRMYDIIAKKRDGGELTAQEIQFFVQGVTDGSIPDYQTSALLMAIYFKGMTVAETVILTKEMAKSGEMVDLADVKGVVVDKHSTGGVGDKTTLIVAPIVASLGGKIAKMSGRGLGHTGGTVDKLESIPGFKTELSPEDFIGQVNNIGISVIGQSGNLAPADKKLYALRDVTATVNSMPLIASSIMSKKLAAGSHNIVLDVKVGSGAFMKTKELAKQLAEIMVYIGNGAGRKTAALLTNMDIPLGNAIGNSLEVAEAVAVLNGKGPKDLETVSIELAAVMLSLCFDKDVAECRTMAESAIKDGSAYTKLKEMVKAQGGNVGVIEHTEMFEKSGISYDVLSQEDGYIARMDAEKIGISSVFLGAGRNKKTDPIDYSAGIIMRAKTGDIVQKGQVIATLYTNNSASLKQAEELYLEAVQIGSEPPEDAKLIYECIF